MGGDTMYTPLLQKSYSWCRASQKGKTYAYCKICQSDINIKRGTYNLKNHEGTEKHKESVIKSGPASSSGIENAKIGALINKYSLLNEQKLRAVSLHCLKTVHTGALASSDMFTKKRGIYKKMFADSQNASTFACGRTKSTYILQNGLAPAARQIILEKLNDEQYELLLDESSKMGKKKLDFHITYIDNNFQWQQTFIASSELSAKSEDVEKFLLSCEDENELKKYVNKKIQGSADLVAATKEVVTQFGLDPKRCIHIQADGCNTMAGKLNGYLKKMSEFMVNLTPSETCITHKLNLASQSIQKQGPFLFKDCIAVLEKISSTLHKSDKLSSVLKKTQDLTGYNSIPGFCETRFLALSRLAEAVLEQYTILKKLFASYNFPISTKTKRIAEGPQHIRDWFQKPSSRLVLDQLNILLLPFRVCNAKTQEANMSYGDMTECVTDCVTLLLTRIGLSSVIDPDKGIRQFYKKDENGEYVPREFKVPESYKTLITKSENLKKEYQVIEKIEVETATKVVRELVIKSLLKQLSGIAQSNLCRLSVLMHININLLIEKEKYVRALADLFPLVDGTAVIDELVLYIRTEDTELSIMTADITNLSKYKNISLLRKCYMCISPSNMSVERGFSTTDWLLSKRRMRMCHRLYQDIKLVLSVYPRNSFEILLEEHWDIIIIHIKKAASLYLKEAEEKKKLNIAAKRKQDHIRTVLNLPPPPQERKKMRKEDTAEEEKLLQRLTEIQKRREANYF